MRRTLVGLAAAALAAAVLPGSLGIAQAAEAQAAADPVVVPIQVTGDDADRFTMVIMGDGYTAADMPKFREQIDTHLNILWSIEPFRSYRNYINVYAVEVESNESGVDCDRTLDAPRRDTALDMAFWGGCRASSVERLLTVNNTKARAMAALASPEFDQVVAIANSDTYGGAGGAYATASGGNSLSALITPHELGHSLGGLQDEYTYYGRGEPGGTYTGGEPSSIHHTTLTEQQMLDQHAKWWRWLGEESEAGGIIGRYPGGQYFVDGIWKPSRHSMMISLGYYFDQVSRERMTQRITQRVELIEDATAGPVGPTDVLWVETAHPVFHQLDVTWRVNGEVVPGTGNSRSLDLEGRNIPAGATVTATVVDNTEFVRDPAIRTADLTATHTWTVADTSTTAPPVEVGFTGSSQTHRAVAHDEVVYVETPHPADRVLDVSWSLDGTVVAGTGNSRNFDLGAHNLTAGTHTLSATVTSPANPGAGSQTLSWTVDNTEAEVDATFSEPLTTLDGEGDHKVYFEGFSMQLDPSDDQPGYVVAEFRRNRDGWHHFYGWPNSPKGTPYQFTPRGTNIDDLIYGSLSPEGLSPQPWEERKPGYGTHLIEYRGIDAAGNIGTQDSINATVLPGSSPECTRTVTGSVKRLTVSDGVTCLDGATVTGGVTVDAGASLVATDSLLDNGGLTADGAAAVQLFGTTVNGPSSITGTTGNVTVAGSTFSGTTTFADNASGDYGVALAGNAFRGDLLCTGNTATVADFGAHNQVAGAASGQCGELDNEELTTALGTVADLLDGYNTGGTISDRTTANLRDRLDRATERADLGHERQAIGYLEQFIARVQNQVKGDAADAAARAALVTAASAAIAELEARDAAETPLR
jgi:hypothetical protein